MIKVDIQKVYDTIDGKFLEQVMVGLGFLNKFIGWVIQCVCIVSFSFLITRELSKPFEAFRGLRQGVSISSFLFAMIMEYLSRNLSDLTHYKQFNYRHMCKRFNITHLSFANDLLMFSRGDLTLVKLLHDKFSIFTSTSRLQENLSKSGIYYGGVSTTVRA